MARPPPSWPSRTLLLPIGDTPNPKKIAWVNGALLIANIAVYLLVSLPLGREITQADLLNDPALAATVRHMLELYAAEGVQPASLTLYDAFVFEHGYQPADGNPADLLACMFLHGGLAHLLGNMLFLWIFGNNVEARLGRIGYLLSYLATGAFATLSFAALNRDSMVPLVGASGAISGVLGLYFVWYPQNRVKILVFLFYFFVDVIYIRAMWVLLFYLVIENLLPALGGSAGSGVAHFAHIGGFVGGAAAGYVLDRLLPRLKPDDFAPEQPFARAQRRVARRTPFDTPMPWRGSEELRETEARARDQGRAVAPSVAFTMAIESGDYEQAASLFPKIAERPSRPPAPHHVLELAEWLEQRRDPEEAARVHRFYIRTYPLGGQLARAHLGLGRVLAGPLGQPRPAQEHLLTAIDLGGTHSEVGKQARTILAHLQRPS